MMTNKQIAFWYWFVGKLPKKLLYFSFMHIMAYSTTGNYSGTVVPELTGLEAIKRFGEDHNIHG